MPGRGGKTPAESPPSVGRSPTLKSKSETEGGHRMNLQDERRRRGWTIVYVAKATGLTRQTIYNAEAGRSVSKRTMTELARVFGKTVDELFF